MSFHSVFRIFSYPRLVLAVALIGMAVPGLPRMARADAPQALGVVALAEPAPLICRDGEYRALVTSFCLEEHRRAPAKGTAYLPAPGTEMTLILTGADGTQHSIPAEEVAEIRSSSHYTVMEIAISEDRLAELGAVSAAITIGPQAALIPKPYYRMGEPHSPADIALLSGPIRMAANRYFDGKNGTGATAQMLADLLTQMPDIGRLPPGLREAAWGRMQAKAARNGTAAEAVEQADQALQECTALADRQIIASEATCLRWRHRDMQVKTNAELWDSLSGS